MSGKGGAIDKKQSMDGRGVRLPRPDKMKLFMRIYIRPLQQCAIIKYWYVDDGIDAL